MLKNVVSQSEISVFKWIASFFAPPLLDINRKRRRKRGRRAK